MNTIISYISQRWCEPIYSFTRWQTVSQYFWIFYITVYYATGIDHWSVPELQCWKLKKGKCQEIFSTWSLVVEFSNYRYGNMFFADSIDTNRTNFALFCHVCRLKSERKDSCTKKDHRHEWLVNSSECLWMSLMYPLFVKYRNMHTM